MPILKPKPAWNKEYDFYGLPSVCVCEFLYSGGSELFFKWIIKLHMVITPLLQITCISYLFKITKGIILHFGFLVTEPFVYIMYFREK